MATAFGHQAFIGFAEESTFGTYTAATNFLRIVSENVKPVYGRNPKPSLGSVGIRQHHAMRQAVEGAITFQVPVTGAELLFKHALGSLATTGTAAPYAHSITVADSLPTGLSFYIDRDQAAIGGSSAFRYSGCQINKLTLTQGPDEFLQCTIDIVGQKQALGAAETPTFPQNSAGTADAVLFDYSDCSGASCTFAGTTTNIIDYELTVENNLNTDRYYLGSTTRHGFGRNGQRKITGKCTAEFDSTTFASAFSDWVSQTGMDHSMLWLNTVDGNNSITCSMLTDNVFFQAGAPEAAGPGIINLPLEFEVFSDPSDTYEDLIITYANYTASI